MGKKSKDKEGNSGRCEGTLKVIGTGPGSLDELSARAKDALTHADVIIGYGTYIDLISSLIEDKLIVRSKMREEVLRAKEAIRRAINGEKVAMVSGGDSGIYAMAGLVLELLETKEFKDAATGLKVEIVPGLPAFVSAASLLGAPLMHDFASISLSDLLTSWEVITKRIDAAASADFVIILYNPRSKGRTTQLPEAVKIISTHRDPSTPVGIVKNSSRANEELSLTTLEQVSEEFESIDMSTIVIIGNSSTFVSSSRMITPRGYKDIK
jgi:precorrin-3B C17-methyltransferase